MILPVVVNRLGMEAYAVPETVPYLHVAFSFVVTLRVVLVVPEAKTPVGAPFERTGGVVSGGRVAPNVISKIGGLLAFCRVWTLVFHAPWGPLR